MLENTPNQPTKFRTENWVEINDNSCGKYNTNSQIKFKFNPSNFWGTFEMPLINCELNLILIWSEDCVISSATGETKLKIADIKLYVPVVALSTQDNAKLLQQLKSGFKRTINWNKYQTKVSTERVNKYLDFLIGPSFQGVNRFFVLSFENEGDRKVHTGYYLPKAEIKYYYVMIDGKIFLDQNIG